MAGPTLAIREQCPLATADNDGLMSAGQAAKLDGLSPGGGGTFAQAYVEGGGNGGTDNALGTLGVGMNVPLTFRVAASGDAIEITDENGNQIAVIRYGLGGVEIKGTDDPSFGKSVRITGGTGGTQNGDVVIQSRIVAGDNISMTGSINTVQGVGEDVSTGANILLRGADSITSGKPGGFAGLRGGDGAPGNSDGGDVPLTVGKSTGTGVDGQVLVDGNIVGNKFYSKQGAVPGVVANANAGVGAVVSILRGADGAMLLSLTTGVGPIAGAMCKVSFATPYRTNPPVVQVSPADLNFLPGGGVFCAPDASITINDFDLAAQSAPVASTTYLFSIGTFGV